MTSCDGNLAKYILPQLVSIEENLCKQCGYNVHFYLAHNRIPSENVQMLESFAKEQTNISFHEVKVTENICFYESLAGGKGGKQWPYEAYLTLRAQDYLPEDVDRILYIDAGDVIIDGDIGPYYFDDFEGNFIIATPLGFKINPISNEKELFTSEDILQLAKHGSLFNSGSYVINIEKFRTEGYSIEDYLYLSDMLIQNAKPGSSAYFGDQGFLAAAFVGHIKFFGYPEYKDPSYMPYNFRSAYWDLFKNEPNYKPVILHYALISKPWVVRFSDEVIDNVIGHPDFIDKNRFVPIPPIAYMTPQGLRLGEVWWKYAKKTPIYEEASMRATITAESWVKHYFPLCTAYNNLGANYNILSTEYNKLAADLNNLNSLKK